MAGGTGPVIAADPAWLAGCFHFAYFYLFLLDLEGRHQERGRVVSYSLNSKY